MTDKKNPLEQFSRSRNSRKIVKGGETLEEDLSVFKKPGRQPTDYSKFSRLARALDSKVYEQFYYPAIVKITSFSRSVEQHARHLDYISRKGELEMEDQDGLLAKGRDDNKDVVDEWSETFDDKGVAKDDGYIIKVEFSEQVINRLKQMQINELQDFNTRLDKRKGREAEFAYLTVKPKTKELSGLSVEFLETLFENEPEMKGLRIEEIGSQRARHTMNLMVSSPKGTNPELVKAAAHDLAKQEFSDKGFKYALVLHTDTDFPHCHICVNATNENGEKIRTYKADLQRFREVYAEKARNRGIPLEASLRRHRSNGKKGEKQSVRAIRDRQKSFDKALLPSELVQKIIEKRQANESRKVGTDLAWIRNQYSDKSQYTELSFLLKKAAQSIKDKETQKHLITIAKVIEKEVDTYVAKATEERSKAILRDESILKTAKEKLSKKSQKSAGDKALLKSHEDTKREYTDAISDIKAIAETEEKKSDKQKLERLIKHLTEGVLSLKPPKTVVDEVLERAKGQAKAKQLGESKESDFDKGL